jgi:hypothetical protein
MARACRPVDAVRGRPARGSGGLVVGCWRASPEAAAETAGASAQVHRHRRAPAGRGGAASTTLEADLEVPFTFANRQGPRAAAARCASSSERLRLAAHLLAAQLHAAMGESTSACVTRRWP